VACEGEPKTPEGFDTDATLSSLSISIGTLEPVFDLSVYNYTATVPNGTDSVDVSATIGDINDSFTINGGENATVALEVGENTISIVVTSEDGLTGRTYRIVITRPPFSQQAIVDMVTGGKNNFFGLITALSDDGNTLAVSSIDEDGVYVFTRDSGGAWAQQAFVKASNSDANDLFGLSAALSGVGNTLAVGAVDEDSAATGVNGDQADNSAPRAGAVYVFDRDSGGAWTQTAYVKASNSDANDLFGLSTALSGDGNTLAVGAVDEDSAATGVNGDQADNSQQNAGAVYVFTRDSGGVWAQQAYVKSSNSSSGKVFGWSVIMSSDGDALAVSAFDEETAGAVYVFTRDSEGVWTQQDYVNTH
jgi:hypothetical protein